MRNMILYRQTIRKWQKEHPVDFAAIKKRYYLKRKKEILTKKREKYWRKK